MPTASTNLQPTLGQRPWLLALVVALVLAPLLANIWPAFGKGPMLFVAEAAGQQSEHEAHAQHAAHGAHEAHEAPADQSHHQRHCALCVLAFLGWAPPIDLSIGCSPTSGTERTKPLVASAKSLESTPVTDSLNVTVKSTLAAWVGELVVRLMLTTVGTVLSMV